MLRNNLDSHGLGVCPACAYHNQQDETRCEKCGRRLPSALEADSHTRPAFPRSSPTLSLESLAPLNQASTDGLHLAPLRSESLPSAGPSSGPRSQHQIIRKQLNTRIRNFRSRRANPNLRLQFEEEEEPQRDKVISFVTISPAPVLAPAAPVMQRPPRRVVRPETLQEPLDFPSAPQVAEGFSALPVAPFRLRLIGHGLDFALTLAAFVVFLIPLRMLAGPVEPTRFLWMGSICAYLVLVLFYGLFFLYAAGNTPTMRWMGLRLVNFDGKTPPRHQRFFRFVGAIASVGSFFLGFLWAAVDDEGLSWHDRISKTFLTTTLR